MQRAFRSLDLAAVVCDELLDLYNEAARVHAQLSAIHSEVLAATARSGKLEAMDLVQQREWLESQLDKILAARSGRETTPGTSEEIIDENSRRARDEVKRSSDDCKRRRSRMALERVFSGVRYPYPRRQTSSPWVATRRRSERGALAPVALIRRDVRPILLFGEHNGRGDTTPWLSTFFSYRFARKKRPRRKASIPQANPDPAQAGISTNTAYPLAKNRTHYSPRRLAQRVTSTKPPSSVNISPMPRRTFNGTDSSKNLTNTDLAALRSFVQKTLSQPPVPQNPLAPSLADLIEQNPDAYRSVIDLLAQGHSIQSVANSTGVDPVVVNAASWFVPDYRAICKSATARNLALANLRMSEILAQRTDSLPVDRVPFALAVSVEKSQLLDGGVTQRTESRQVVSREELQKLFDQLPRANARVVQDVKFSSPLLKNPPVLDLDSPAL